MLENFRKEYFTFNRTERKGIRFLLVIILLQLSGIVLIPYVMPERKTDYSIFDAKVKEFLASVDTVSGEEDKEWKHSYSSSRTYTNYDKKSHTFRPFDPNGLPAGQWIEMGLSEKQAATIKNYEAKGGHFYRKEDLKKLFVITEAFYNRVEPYIQIAENRNTEHLPEEPLKARIEVNTATLEQLITINGIGEKLAERIVTYRDRLGGFHSIEQLREVYGLFSENYEKISRQLVVSGPVQKIDLNYCDIKELGKHPYVGFKKAREIIDYRNRHGFFKNTEQLRTAGLADDSVYAKLVPYITLP
jgi:competence ComEA-like helix-hairpin-helix protein